MREAPMLLRWVADGRAERRGLLSNHVHKLGIRLPQVNTQGSKEVRSAIARNTFDVTALDYLVRRLVLMQ